MLTTTRRAIQYPNPDRSDRADMATHIGFVALAADSDVLFTQGTDAARQAASHQTGGGRFWWASDTLLMWYDDGTSWRSLAPTTTLTGTLAAIPAATSLNSGYLYFATDDQGGRIYRSNGTVWTVISVGLSDSRLSDQRIPTSNSVDNSKVSDGALTPAKIAGTAVITTDSRLSDQRVPTPNSVDNTKVADNTLAPAKITGTAVINSDSRLSDQRVPSANSVDDTKVASQALSPGKINGTAVVTADARLSDQRVPTANSVDDSKVAVGALSPNRIAGTAVVNSDARLSNARVPAVGYDPTAANTVFPTSGLFNGYRFTLLMPGHSIGGYVAADCIYRPDLDGTYPWHVAGGGDLINNVYADINNNSYTFFYMGNQVTVPRSGWWNGFGYVYGNSGGGGGVNAQLVVGGAVFPGAGWGNSAHNAYNACVAQVSAGGSIYFQGQSSLDTTVNYRGQVGARPVRLA